MVLMNKKICQLYIPSFYRSYGKNAILEIIKLLPDLKKRMGFDGVYLISIWKDGGYDNGFDVIQYRVNPKFGTDAELDKLIKKAHELGIIVGVDVVPNHVSDKNVLAQNCLNDVPGYEDCLYVVSKEEAKRLTKAGVPNYFGKLAYSDFGDKYVRSTFADYHQLNLNWNSQKVQEYFIDVFKYLKRIGIDFARIDCGMMLHEDVTKADPDNDMACMNPAASIEAIRKVSGGMPLFFEWFKPSLIGLFNDLPECYALDCSYVMTGKKNLKWDHKKQIPLLGGHDQMTVADRGINIRKALAEASKSDYAFLDIQTMIGWKTDSKILPGDEDYDADLKNQNQRYRARRPIEPVLKKLRQILAR
ncbi:MAG: alpha-amylase family glycosyl hydrolase [Candidatus Saccharibacteria bacterium]|nr:alpha-amylase family glycosyl hydrolase [Candidatus Saccharibacteria bacterium]